MSFHVYGSERDRYRYSAIPNYYYIMTNIIDQKVWNMEIYPRHIKWKEQVVEPYVEYPLF